MKVLRKKKSIRITRTHRLIKTGLWYLRSVDRRTIRFKNSYDYLLRGLEAFIEDERLKAVNRQAHRVEDYLVKKIKRRVKVATTRGA